MATTNGKGTTPKTTFISLAKAIALAEKEPLHKWIDAYREFVRSGATDKLAWATQMEQSVRGTRWDTHTAGSIRVNLSHIEWAEANIIGGAKACKSMNHIVKQKKGDKPASKPVQARKVSTVTVNEDEFTRTLRKAGLAPEVIAIARKAVFTTAK